MTAHLAHKTRDPNVADVRDAAAVYIGSMSGDLAELARRHGLDTLGYLLEMARLEADNVASATVCERD